MHHGRDHLHREFVERSGPGEAPRAAPPVPEKEPEDETQRTLLRAGGRGMFIGSPTFVRENLRRFGDAHIDIINFTMQFEPRRHEHIMETLELFAKEVTPEFQERHAQLLKWREQQLDGITLPINSSI